MNRLRGDAVKLGLAAVVVMLLSWFVGWWLSPWLLLAVVLVVLAVRGLDLAVPTLPVRWPDPGDATRSRWGSLDGQVRRLARAVDTAEDRDAPELRQAIHDELCRRLVARHGADPADPLATAEGVVPADLLVAATTPGRVRRRQLDDVLDHLEEL